MVSGRRPNNEIHEEIHSDSVQRAEEHRSLPQHHDVAAHNKKRRNDHEGDEIVKCGAENRGAQATRKRRPPEQSCRDTLEDPDGSDVITNTEENNRVEDIERSDGQGTEQ